MIGGGVIGCEFAPMFSDLGTEVTIPEALPKILPGLDKDVTQVVERSFKKRDADPHRSHRHRSPAGRRRHLSAEGGRPDRGRRRGGVGGSAARTPTTCSSTARTSSSARRASSRSTLAAARPRRCHGRSATSRHPPWPVGFAEGMVAIRDILGEGPSRSTTTRCHGASTPPEAAFTGPRSCHRGRARRRSAEEPLQPQRPAMIVNANDGLVKVIAEKNADGTAGRVLGVRMVAVGDRAARLGLSRRQLGGDGRRGRFAHPTAPHAQRGVRRGGHLAHRAPPARLTTATPTGEGRPRWPTSRCPSWERP